MIWFLLIVGILVATIAAWLWFRKVPRGTTPTEREKPTPTITQGVKVTEGCLANLQSEGVSDEVLDKVRTLMRYPIPIPVLLQKLKSTAGDKQARNLQTLILKHGEECVRVGDQWLPKKK